jgi:hypothetical protein
MKTCTWEIEAHYGRLIDGERSVIAARECGKRAVVEWSKKKEPGRIPYIQHYPRCKTHSPPLAYQTAIKEGFEITELDEEVK